MGSDRERLLLRPINPVQTRVRQYLRCCTVGNEQTALDVLPGQASIPIGFRDILGFNSDADGPESLGIIGIKFALFNGRQHGYFGH